MFFDSRERALLHDLLERILAVHFERRVVLLGAHLGLAHRREALVLLPGHLAGLLQVALVVRLLLRGLLQEKKGGGVEFNARPRMVTFELWPSDLRQHNLRPLSSCGWEMLRSWKARCGHPCNEKEEEGNAR